MDFSSHQQARQNYWDLPSTFRRQVLGQRQRNSRALPLLLACATACESAYGELLTDVGSSQSVASERSFVPDLPAAAVFMLSARTCKFVHWGAWRILNLSPVLAPCKRLYSATSEDGPNEDVAKIFLQTPFPGRRFSREEVSRGGMGPGLSVRQKRVGAQVMAALARELQHGPLRDP